MKRLLTIIMLLGFLGTGPALANGNGATIYERVMKNGVIRCGYVVWPPFFQIDSATGKFSGMNYDYVEAVGAALGFKIDWALEVTPGDQAEALRSGKIDAMCAAEGPMTPSTIKYIHYSEAIAYFPFYLYARSDDKRFDRGIQAINNPDVRIAVIDGDISGQLAGVQFQKARLYPMPQLTAPGQMMLDVASGKADIVINDPLSMSDYFKNNPGKLRRIPTGDPIAIIPNTLSVLRGEDSQSFLDLLNQGIENVRYTGRERMIFERYMKPDEDYFYPAAKPYR